MSNWNPDLYLQYKDERTQPSYDLVARIALANPQRIADIGCGPGNSTRVLMERWPAAHILGLDSSPQMIAKAQQDYPQGDWILADAATWQTSECYDLVFSNAALQWIPDHETLVGALFDRVASAGCLAVQVPANQDSPIYKAVRQVSQMGTWRDVMAGCDARPLYYSASFYYDRLASLSGMVAMWQTTYYHVMADHQGIIAWYASTGLKPYLARLADDAQRTQFQSQVLAECRPQYPTQQDGKVLFPFKRMFLIAYKE